MFGFSVQKRKNCKNIVCIGGGTGLFSLLSGLKNYVGEGLSVKAIVTTLDNGGSSGKLITQYGVLPPGDIRNCLVALSTQSEVLNKLFQYRFDDQMHNHNFGNLLITALSDITGSFDQAIKEASKILRVRGEVIPVSLEKNNLKALLDTGEIIVGESVIDQRKDKKIDKIYLEKEKRANPRVIRVLKEADMIVFGPGDLYTSIIPNVLFDDVRNAINFNKKAKKVLISPVMSKPGETDDYKVSDFKSELEKYIEGNITHVLANSHVIANSSLQEYRKENKFPVSVDEENLKDCKLIKGDFVDESQILRHSPKKISKIIVDLL